MARIHFYGDLPDSIRPSLVYDAAEHAEGTGGRYIRLGNLAQLGHWLTRLRAEGTRVDFMDFHSHGGPGSARLGDDRLTAFRLAEFEGRNHHQLFAADARIEFHGCNVAESPEGELLVAEFGRIMLRGGGGTAKGSTGRGTRDWLYTGHTFHPTGRWITAGVRAGGGVSLAGHIHLHANLVRDEIERMNRSRQLESTLQARRHLGHAERLLGAAGSQPSYRNIYDARRHLAQARRLSRSTPTMAH